MLSGVEKKDNSLYYNNYMDSLLNLMHQRGKGQWLILPYVQQ